ncbi:MAG TPA: TetR family transcriptional regulator [Trebonia sp.]|jgi:AcrR family transcriptional regulator
MTPAAVDARDDDVTGPRRMRADAARNRQRLIDAAAEVFAARGLDATLDDIARHAGVNVATAYRHFANKHELAREFLRRCIDQAASIAEEAAANPDPWAGLTQFLERSLEMIASNHALVDVLTRDYDGEHFAELVQRTSQPLERLLARGQQDGVVRADLAAADFGPILEMLSAITGLGVPGLPYLPHRYITLILAGLRPGQEPLYGEPPSEESLLQVAESVAGTGKKRHVLPDPGR